MKAVFLSAMGPKRFKTGGVASAGAADKSWEAALVAARLQEVKAAKGGAAGRAVPGVEGVKGDDDGGPGLRSGPGGRRVGPGRPVDRPGGRRSCSPPGPRSPAGFLLFLLGTFFFFF